MVFELVNRTWQQHVLLLSTDHTLFIYILNHNCRRKVILIVESMLNTHENRYLNVRLRNILQRPLLLLNGTTSSNIYRNIFASFYVRQTTVSWKDKLYNLEKRRCLVLSYALGACLIHKLLCTLNFN